MGERQNGDDALHRVRYHLVAIGVLQEIVFVESSGGDRENGDDQQRDEDLHPVERQCPAEHGAHRRAGLTVEETRAVGERDGYAGQEYEKLGSVGKPEIPLRNVLEHVLRQMVDEDRQQRKTAPEVDTVYPLRRSRHFPLTPRFHGQFSRLTIIHLNRMVKMRRSSGRGMVLSWMMSGGRWLPRSSTSSRGINTGRRIRRWLRFPRRRAGAAREKGPTEKAALERFPMRLRHNGATPSVCSPPPWGGGLGRGVARLGAASPH